MVEWWTKWAAEAAIAGQTQSRRLLLVHAVCIIVAVTNEWFVDFGGGGRDSMADDAPAAVMVDNMGGRGHRRPTAIEATAACSCGVDDRC